MSSQNPPLYMAHKCSLNILIPVYPNIQFFLLPHKSQVIFFCVCMWFFVCLFVFGILQSPIFIFSLLFPQYNCFFPTVQLRVSFKQLPLLCSSWVWAPTQVPTDNALPLSLVSDLLSLFPDSVLKPLSNLYGSPCIHNQESYTGQQLASKRYEKDTFPHLLFD